MKRPILLAIVVSACLACGSNTSNDSPATTGPLTAPAETWTWFDVAGTQCANGTRTGL